MGGVHPDFSNLDVADPLTRVREPAEKKEKKKKKKR